MPEDLAHSSSPSAGRNHARLWLAVLAPFVLAHFVSYLYRNVNAVVYPELTHELGLAADDLGLLTSAYFLMFALAQLPIGVALDRFGPRKVQAPMLIIAALGALWFSQAHSLTDLVIGRGLIGFGVAGSLMAAIKASSLWLPRQKQPLSTALLLSVGGLGALASTTPMHVALSYTDWRSVFVILSAATLGVSAIIFFVVPEHPQKVQVKLSDMAIQVVQLYGAWSFWRLTLYTVVAHATYMSVQGLWMGLWLHDVGHLERSEVADILLAGTVAMVAGTLSFGWATDRFSKKGIQPIFVCGSGVVLFLLCQGLMIGNVGLSPAWIAVGFSFFGAATTMNYAIVSASVPLHLTGRVSTSFNLVVFLMAFALQWGLGWMIGLWTPIAGMYPETAYRFALGANLALQIPGLLLWFSMKPWHRTHPLEST